MSGETTDEMRKAELEERGMERKKELQPALLVLKRDTSKAVIMTQKECNYFSRMPDGSECLLIVMGDNLIDHRYKYFIGLNWCLSLSGLTVNIQALSLMCQKCLHPVILPGRM